MDHDCGTTRRHRPRLPRRRRRRLRAELAARPARRRAHLARPVVVLRHRPRQGDATPRCAAQTFRAGGGGAEVGVNAIDKGIQIFQAIRQLEDTWGLTKTAPAVRARALHDPPRRRHRRPERRAGAVRHLRVHDVRVLRLVPPGGGPRGRAGARSRRTSPRAAQLDPWLREHPPELEWKLNWPASVVDPDAPHRRHRLRRPSSARPPARGSPARPRCSGFAAVEDTSWLNAKGIPAISCGAGDLRVAHADDEYVLIDELMAACRTYAATALDWCGWSE